MNTISDERIEAYLQQTLTGYGLGAALEDEPADTTNPPRPLEYLTVVYDEQCELCRRCHHWLAQQPAYVPLTFLAAGAPVSTELYAHLPWYRSELMVIADTGATWVGSSAFIICLWATRRYRPLSYRLRGRAFAPLAESFFHALSSKRSVVSAMLTPHECDAGTCATTR